MEKNYLTKVFLMKRIDLIFGKALQFALEKEKDYDVTLFQSRKLPIFLKARSAHEPRHHVSVDCNLPDMSGIEILKKINVYNKDIATVFLSERFRKMWKS